jgi:hypothetical protein
MSNHIFVLILGWPALIAVCAYAWIKGDTPARISGGMLMIVAVLAWLIAHSLPFEARAVPMLVTDGLLAFGFLLLALRYASLWLAATMVLQGMQFSLHAYYLVMTPSGHGAYGLVNNLITYAVMACILGGTVIAQRRRQRARAEQTRAEA